MVSGFQKPTILERRTMVVHQTTREVPFVAEASRCDYKQVNILCLRPEIPVGGHLQFFWRNWEKITNDNWVITIVREGYKLEFLKQIPKTGIIQTNVSVRNTQIIMTEVSQLLEKGAIESVPAKEKQDGFYSTFFLVPKKNRRLKTSNQSKTSEQVSQKTTLQNGLSSQCVE